MAASCDVCGVGGWRVTLGGGGGGGISVPGTCAEAWLAIMVGPDADADADAVPSSTTVVGPDPNAVSECDGPDSLTSPGDGFDTDFGGAGSSGMLGGNAVWAGGETSGTMGGGKMGWAGWGTSGKTGGGTSTWAGGMGTGRVGSEVGRSTSSWAGGSVTGKVGGGGVRISADCPLGPANLLSRWTFKRSSIILTRWVSSSISWSREVRRTLRMVFSSS